MEKYQKKSLEDYAKMPVSKAVVLNTIPAMIAMAMTLIYNLADTFFIAQTGNAYMVAAVSLATPVFLFFMAAGTIFGIGGTSVISRAEGEGRHDYSRKVCAFCFWLCVIVGIAMSALFLIFTKPILKLVGTSDETYEFTKSYFTIVCFSGPFVLIANAYSSILRAEGEANKATIGQVIGNLLNVILDPIFISVLNLGTTGAAIATVIGNFCGAMYYIFYYLMKKSNLSISPKYFSAKEGIAKNVLSIGIPGSLASVMMSFSQIIMNAMMAGFGDMAVAGIGVAAKVTMITGMLCMGIGQGSQSLLGFEFGRKNFPRFKKIMSFSLLFSFIVGCVLTALCYIFTRQIASVFLSEGEAFDYAIVFIRILLTTSFLFGIFYVLTNALQAVGAAISALIINLSRQGLIYIPALFVMRAVAGAYGLVWAQPVADVLSTLLAIVLFARTVRKANAK